DDQDRVVAGERADDLAEPGAVDGAGGRVGLPGTGAEDDQLLHAVDAGDELGDAAAEARESGAVARRRPGGLLIGADARALDQAELLDVARERRLRDGDTTAQQAAPQLLLAADRLAVEKVENERLAPGLHDYAVGRMNIQDRRIEAQAGAAGEPISPVDPSRRLSYSYPLYCIHRDGGNARRGSGVGRRGGGDGVCGPGADPAAGAAPAGRAPHGDGLLAPEGRRPPASGALRRLGRRDRAVRSRPAGGQRGRVPRAAGGRLGRHRAPAARPRLPRLRPLRRVPAP